MRKRSKVGSVLAVVVGMGLGAGCGDALPMSGQDQAALRGGQPAAGQGGGEDLDGEDNLYVDEDGEGFVPVEGELPPDFCENGGAVGRIDVTFECDSITIISCKDLSNVVLEFADGTRQKFDGLSGQSATFSGTGANAGKQITGVWVKAGANHSGDGPGYGERFDAPGEMSCDDVPPGDGDGDGDSDVCGDQPDEECPPPGGDGDGDGDGDSGDGDGDSGDGDGDGDGDSGDGDGDGDGCVGLDEDCGGEVPPPPPDTGCMGDPSIPCDPI